MVILLIPQRGSTVMTSTSPVFVLVPGVWHGGWAWQPVARRLREAGCAAVTITLPGLADGDKRGGLRLSDASDHVVAEAGRRDLREVVLVGHSWGGYVITGAAHRRYRIRPRTRRDRTGWLPGTRRGEPVGWPAIHHATPAPELMFCERGLTDAYCFSRHSYSAFCLTSYRPGADLCSRPVTLRAGPTVRGRSP